MNAHPTDLVANTVALLRLFSGLITNELDGDESRVYAYPDTFPGDNLATAILNAPPPSVMVAYMGFGKGEILRNEVLKHELRLFVRPPQAPNAETSGSHNIIYEIENGTDSDGNQFRQARIHEECYPIGIDMKSRRLPTDSGVDIWEVTFLLTEISG
jgi:hypothetical protein